MDNFAHGRVHWSMTVVFVVGTALSAIFQSGEVVSTVDTACLTPVVAAQGSPGPQVPVPQFGVQAHRCCYRCRLRHRLWQSVRGGESFTTAPADISAEARVKHMESTLPSNVTASPPAPRPWNGQSRSSSSSTSSHWSPTCGRQESLAHAIWRLWPSGKNVTNHKISSMTLPAAGHFLTRVLWSAGTLPRQKTAQRLSVKHDRSRWRC